MFEKLTVPILLLYVFFRDFRPSEPFLTPYLRETKNFTKHEVNNMIYPVWSYSQLPIFIFVLATTDILRYRPVILLGALGYVATWLILIFGTTVEQMELMQVTYAVGTACEVAYKSYVFVAVAKADYSKVSLYLSVSTLLGRATSSFTSQLLHDLGSVSFLSLTWISLVSVSIATILALAIPAPRYLEIRDAWEPDPLLPNAEDPSFWDKTRARLRKVRQDVVVSYKSAQTRRWSYWAVVCSLLYFMIGNSSQSLWKDLETEGEKRYNGYVIGTSGLLSSITSYVLTRYSRRVEQTRGWVLVLLTSLMTLTILLPTILQNLYLAYVCDALFNMIVTSCITISLFKIAHSMTTNLYGFVVGVNACVAGTLDLLVTLIVIDERVLGWNPRQQYWVYAGFGLLSVAGYCGYRVVVGWRRQRDGMRRRRNDVSVLAESLDDAIDPLELPGEEALRGFVNEGADSTDDEMVDTREGY